MSMTQADMAAGAPPLEAGPPPAAPMEGEATADQAMAAMEDQRMAELETIAASAPEPEKPFTASLVEKLSAALNDLMSMVDETIAPIDYVAEAPRVEGPLPGEVYVPLVLTLMYVAQIGGYDKYAMNPEELINDAAVRKATALVQMMQKDDALIEDLQQPAEGIPEEEMEGEELPPEASELPAEPVPGEYDDEDEALMAEM